MRTWPLVVLAACGTAPTNESPTWHADVAPIVAQRCATCHRPDDVGPFSLTTYEEVAAVSLLVKQSVESGSMPPWQPSDDCNSYAGNIDLTAEEKKTLLDWIDADLPEGDPSDAVEFEVASPSDGFEATLSVPLPEAYTPQREPDDYRCQVVDLGLTETSYVTGLRVTPDQRAIVHHTIVFIAPAEHVGTFQAMADAEEGPGYTCFGGPNGGSDEGEEGGFQLPEGVSLPELIETFNGGGDLPEGIGLSTTRWVGSWVPGSASYQLPPGTGLRLDPGDHLIVQMHYNTLAAAPVPDKSLVELQLADSVDKEAYTMPFTDLGWVTGLDFLGGPMTIPAGDASASHSTTQGMDSVLLGMARSSLGLSPTDNMVLHRVGGHLHELGTSIRVEALAADDTETCLMDLPDWDFSWQGNYTLTEPVVLRPDDRLRMSCTWDNSTENQVLVDGEMREPQEVSWGEGTTDEMCLGVLYFTAE